MSSQSYKKKCMYCDHEIVMDVVNGKWGAYNLNGGFHQCSSSNQENGSKPIVMVNEQEQITIESLNIRIVRLELVIDAMVNSAGAKK